MKQQQRFDWGAFALQFFLGAMVGAVMGFVALGKSPFAGSTSPTPTLWFTGLGALIGGLLAAFWR